MKQSILNRTLMIVLMGSLMMLLSACSGFHAVSRNVSTSLSSVSSDSGDNGGGGVQKLAPVIGLQPSSASVNQGAFAAFQVIASGTSLTYQWYHNGNEITGATADFYLIPNAQAANSGIYSVLITDANGLITSSNAAQLTIVSPFSIPQISLQPLSQTILTGQNVFFQTTATGGDLNYQWYFNGQPIAGAIGPIYSINNISATNAGSYTVVVSNSVGSTTSQIAQLSVTPLPPANCEGNHMPYAQDSSYLPFLVFSDETAAALSRIIPYGSNGQRVTLNFPAVPTNGWNCTFTINCNNGTWSFESPALCQASPEPGPGGPQ